MRWETIALLTLSWAGFAQAAPADKEAAAHYASGAKAFEEGDFSKAADELKQAVALKPTVKALLTLGNTYVKLGQLDDARAAFEQILVIDPRSSKRKTVEGLIRDLSSLAKTKLVLTTTPPGATVFIDLKAEGARGKTPLTLPVLPGRHRVILELEGYEPVTLAEVTAIEGQDVPVDAALKIRGCDLTVTATPPRATVRVDGGELHPTPLNVRVAVGEHKLAFAGDGLAPRTRVVGCEEKALAVNEALEPLPMGVLALHVPSSAQVNIDGVKVSTLDAARLQLEPGARHVEVLAPGRAPWRSTVTVQNGDRTEVTPELEAPRVEIRPTTIVVVPEPPHASIRVDGKPLHRAEAFRVEPGRHEIEIRARGWTSYWRAVDLAEGQTLQVEGRLRRRGENAFITGAIFTVLAGAAEAAAITAHVSADREFADSTNFSGWRDTELGANICAGILGGVALISYIAGIVQVTTEGSVRGARLDAERNLPTGPLSFGGER